MKELITCLLVATSDFEHMKSPLERVGPLSDDWDRCMERPKR